MKLCLNTLMWPDLSLSEILAVAEPTGIRRLEIGATLQHPQLGDLGDAAHLEALRVPLADWRVAAVSADHPDFPRERADGGAAAVAHTVAAVKVASALGAGVVVLSLGQTDVDPWEYAWERTLDGLADVLRLTNRTHVRLAVRLDVEDVFDSLNKARRLLALISDRRLGIALDTGVLYYRRIELREALKVIGPRLYHVQVRDATRADFNRAIGQGEVGFAGAFRALQEAGYAGALSVMLDPLRGGSAEGVLTEGLPLLQAALEEAG